MEVLPYFVMFSVILIGASCIIVGQESERWAGIVILFMVTVYIVMFIIIDRDIIRKDIKTIIYDIMIFFAFFTISLKSVKIWPTFCSGILFAMVSASVLKNFGLPIGIFGEDDVRIACHFAVYTAVAIGLWRNNSVRR